MSCFDFRRGPLSRIVILAVSTVAIACSGPSDPVVKTEITELTVPATAIDIGQGYSKSALVGIRRSSTFTGDVTLSAVNLPAGLLASFEPTVLDRTEELSELSLTALASIPAGNYTFLVRASGVGIEDKTATVAVNITIPEFTLASTVASATVEQGATKSVPISITRSGGFALPVGLSVFGLPAGVTASFSPPALELGATESTVTFSAPLTTATGTSQLTLRATAQGMPNKTIPLTLTIAPTTTPAVTLSAAPPFLQITQGQGNTSTITVQRYAGYAGAVDIAVEDLPSDITATVLPIAAGSNSTTIQFDVAPDAVVRANSVVLRATGAGIAPASALFTVQVQPSPTFNISMLAGQGANTSTIGLTVTRGSQFPFIFNLTRIGGFSENVALTVTGIPPGVAMNLPLLFTPTTGSGILVIVTAAADTTPGNYVITITATATGGITRTGTINLTVQ